MPRTPFFEKLFNMSLNEELLVKPNDGESVPNAVRRLRVRTSKYRPDGKTYVVEARDDHVWVKRVEFGRGGSAWRWLAMTNGETIRLSDSPGLSEITAAKKRADYLNDRPKQRGMWQVQQASDGGLDVLCVIDADGNFNEEPARAKQAKEETEERRALGRASAYRATAAFVRTEAKRTTSGTDNWLLEKAERFDLLAAIQKDEAEALAANRERAQATTKGQTSGGK